jgi:hypothetical protein
MRTTEREVEVVRLTTRGWVVLVIIPSFLLLVGLWQVSANLWYVGEGGGFLGYCWGTMAECFKGGL